MGKWLRRVVSVVLVYAAVGCGTRELSVPASDAYPPTFSAIRERILKPRCASCHPKIVLYSAIMSDLVVAGRPGSSAMFEEIDSGGMPKYGGKISDEEINAVKTWIENGASND